MLLSSSWPPGRIARIPFSPLLIGEDAAVIPAATPAEPQRAFQSPPHRGRCCCSRPSTSDAARFTAFSPLLIGEDAAVHRGARPGRGDRRSFSPLLIGEDAAVRGDTGVQSHRSCLSVPSSSGKMLLCEATSAGFARCFTTFSPLLIGEDAAVSSSRNTNSAALTSFSPLLIGEDAAVGRLLPEADVSARLSVPSSSGKMLL